MNWLKRLWHYLWHEDTWGSFVLVVLIAFVVIRYLAYPALGLVLGTGFPIVAVVSGSMEHDGTYEEWWSSECCQGVLCTQKKAQSSFYSDYNITQHEFLTYRFPHGFNKGDIMLLAGANTAQVGDTIVFVGQHRAEPIIHRLIQTDGQTYRTKGDHNCGIADFEQSISQDQLVGKAILRVPFLGYIKILFVQFLSIFGVAAL
jgi:signal peptidase I